MPRSIYCSSCYKEKEPGRDNESCCKTCKSERNKAKRARIREEKGMKPFGSGPSLFCYCCGAPNESGKKGYCNACRRQKDNESRLAKGITKKHQTGLCPCGAQRAPYSTAYCKECLARRGAERKPLTEEQVLARNLRNRRNYARKRAWIESAPIIPLTHEERLVRNHARNLARSRIRSGTLIKMPCETCGTEVNIEAHHDDYSKPLEVRWLCRKHHYEHHVNERLEKQNANT